MEALIRKINCGCVPAGRRGSYQTVEGSVSRGGRRLLSEAQTLVGAVGILIAAYGQLVVVTSKGRHRDGKTRLFLCYVRF